MKKTIIILLASALIGGLMASYIFKNKSSTKEQNLNGQTMISAFQIGAYTSKENAKKSAVKNNGVVIEDNNVYRVYVTLLKNKESIQKMEEYFKSINLSYYIKDIYVKNEFYNEIVEDEHLINSSEQNTYNTINKDIINKYEGTI